MIYKLRRMDESESSYNDIVGRYPELARSYYIEEHEEYYLDEFDCQQVHTYCTIDIDCIEELLKLIDDTGYNITLRARDEWDKWQQPYNFEIVLLDDVYDY